MHVQTALYLCEFMQYSPLSSEIYPVCANSELISLLLFCKKYSEETEFVNARWNVQDQILW